ncbi:MAG: prepilin-type N-terminal cleavage/methylation domain-containing protein [Clostridiales Family XIII bacterium]|jgi:prepilin-type N-terminal cleavage/methylation domain-containing protein|nr:prepilin-type N-terminal cleavage/methylation domain-containing protein [Clostridiales Family XIII bacterium]
MMNAMLQRKIKTSDKNGFTLLEVIIALAIVAIAGTMALMGFQVSNNLKMKDLQEKSDAAEVEMQIATGEGTVTTGDAFNIRIADQDFSTYVDTYTSTDGSKLYSVIHTDDEVNEE